MTAPNTDTETWRDYRSPFADAPSGNNSAHYWWTKHCRDYMETGDLKSYCWMLHHVTLDNPPDAPKPVPVRTGTKRYITSVTLILLAAFTISGTFGGFRAVAALAAVLLIIFASSWPG